MSGSCGFKLCHDIDTFQVQERKNFEEEVVPLLGADGRREPHPSVECVSMMCLNGQPSGSTQSLVSGIQEDFRLWVFEANVRDVFWMFDYSPAI